MRNFFKKGQNYGVRKPIKGNKKLTKRQINAIRPEAEEQIKSSCDFQIRCPHFIGIKTCSGRSQIVS